MYLIFHPQLRQETCHGIPSGLLKQFASSKQSYLSVDASKRSLLVSMHHLTYYWAEHRLSAEQKHTSWIRVVACSASRPWIQCFSKDTDSSFIETSFAKLYVIEYTRNVAERVTIDDMS